MVNTPRANKERSAAELKLLLEQKEAEIARLKKRIMVLEGVVWVLCCSASPLPTTLRARDAQGLAAVGGCDHALVTVVWDFGVCVGVCCVWCV